MVRLADAPPVAYNRVNRGSDVGTAGVEGKNGVDESPRMVDERER